MKTLQPIEKCYRQNQPNQKTSISLTSHKPTQSYLLVIVASWRNLRVDPLSTNQLEGYNPRMDEPDPLNQESVENSPLSTPLAEAGAYRLAYNEGIRNIDDQKNELSSIRQRSLQYLAFVGAATGFLVATGIKNPSRDPMFYVIAFSSTTLSFLSLILAMLILLGIRLGKKSSYTWTFMVHPRLIIKKIIEVDGGIKNEAELLRKLALSYGNQAELNEPEIRKIRITYIAFLICASMQLILWTWLVWAYAH